MLAVLVGETAAEGELAVEATLAVLAADDGDEVGVGDEAVDEALEAVLPDVERFEAVDVDVAAAVAGTDEAATTAGWAEGDAGTTVFARYLSQSESMPPTSLYFCRANWARLSPAGVPLVRFTERARYLKPSACSVLSP